MTIYAFDATFNTTASNFALGTSDRVLVGVNGFVFSPSQTLFQTNSAFASYSVSYTVLGSMFSLFNCINLGQQGNQSSNFSIRVGASGAIDGSIAIQAYGTNGSISNDGHILGDIAIALRGAFGGENLIVNNGLIAGTSYTIIIDNTSTASLRLINTGTIGDGSSTEAITNFDSVVANDNIRNAGLMIGHVQLGGGNDRYDGRGGEVLGTVLGGVGNDTFIAGSEIDTFYGDLGTDTLDFRLGSGVALALDGRFDNSGTATGDTYVGIETIIGSATGSDNLRGDGFNNKFFGMGGNDRLDGAGGNDVLEGRNGSDTLTGGIGDDRFVFRTLTEGADVILDFSSAAAGNNDSIYIVASAFGGGLGAGALLASQLQVRADNIAQDSNDRFIFRTTDRTLWFDANGSGSGGAVLIADLQSAATMTALDILLV
jgi:hypothetical protein